MDRAGHQRIDALDGLRAVAVGLVFAYHAAFGRPSGGFIGVDVFFVLSGFLITSLLVAEFDRSERVDLRAFYGRRVRRLLPAAVLAVALAGVVVWLAPETEGTRGYPVAAVASLTATANFFGMGALGLLQPMWSLAVEEQFYLLWPTTLAALRRRGRTVTGIGAIAAGSFALGAIAQLVADWDVYLVTIPRFAELMVGCGLAVLLHDGTMPAALKRPIESPLVAASALAAVLGLGVVMDIHSEANFLGLLLVVCTATAVVVAHCATTTSVLTRLLSVRPLVWVGTISYGIYVFHDPIALLLTPDRLRVPSPLVIGVRIFVTLVVATVSFVFVEQPIRRRSRRPITGTVGNTVAP